MFAGHSLGAGLAILLGLLIRPRYPNVRVYAFATPGNCICMTNIKFISTIYHNSISREKRSLFIIFFYKYIKIIYKFFNVIIQKAGLLSREAARVTEEFVLTIGLGDDLVMRLSVDSIENLRTSLLTTLRACRLPKVYIYIYINYDFHRNDYVNRTAVINIFIFSVQSDFERIWICFVWSS